MFFTVLKKRNNSRQEKDFSCAIELYVFSKYRSK